MNALSIDFLDDITLNEHVPYSGEVLYEYESIVQDYGKYKGVLYFDVDKKIGFIIDHGGYLQFLTPTPCENGFCIIRTMLYIDGSIEYIGKEAEYPSKKQCYEDLIQVSNNHYDRLREATGYSPSKNTYVEECHETTVNDTSEPHTATPSQSTVVNSTGTYTAGRCGNGLMLMERVRLATAQGMKRTYTQEQINNGEAICTYEDQDNHIIRVSNTISRLNVRCNQPGIDEQIVEYNSGNDIQSLGPSCFHDCHSLEKVMLQDNVTIFEDHCFSNCSGLHDINIESLNLQHVGDYAFQNCGISSLDISLYTCNGGYMGNGIFDSCHRLKNVNFQTNYFSDYTFQNCEQLTSLTVTLSSLDEFVEIGEYAVNSISSLKECTICGDIQEFPLMDNMESLDMVNLTSNNDCATIQNYTFVNTPSLTSLTLYEFINSINQISPSALCKSSIKQLKTLGISYDDMLASFDTWIRSEDDEYFVVDRRFQSSIQHGDHSFHNKDYPSPIQSRINTEENPTFYYGKIYSQLDKAMEFSIKNKVPILIHSGMNFLDTDSNQLFSRKLFFDWLEQQPFIFVIRRYDNHIPSKEKFMINETYNIQREEVRSNNGSELLQACHFAPFAERPKLYSYYSYPYSGNTYFKYLWDQGSCIFKLKNDDTISSFYKFYNTNTNPIQKGLIYDLKNNKIGNEWDKGFGYNNQRVHIDCLGERHGVAGVEKNRDDENTFINPKGIQGVWQYYKKYPTDEWPFGYGLEILYIPDDSSAIEEIKYKNHDNFYNQERFMPDFNDITMKRVLNGKTYLNYSRINGTLGAGGQYLFHPTYYGNEKYSNILSDYNNVKEYNEARNNAINSFSPISRATNSYDIGVKNTMRLWDMNFKNLLKDYKRDSRFNAPDYKYKEINLEYLPTEKVPFNCWGIEHDCEIWTSDHIKAKWTYKTQKLSKIGKW